MKNTQEEYEPRLNLAGGGTRVGYIDALKGFAILCVVLGHVADGYLDGSTYPEAGQGLFYVFNAIYAFHMPLFMMLSGYVYAVAYFDADGRPDRKRIYKQTGNIAITYVLFSVVFGLIKVALGRFTNKPIMLTDILFIWGRPISPYWYLYDLMPLYLLFSIPVVDRVDQRLMLGVLAAAAILSEYMSVSWFHIPSILYYALFFFVGLSERLYSGWLLGNRWISSAAFAVSIILCIVFWDRGPYTVRDEAVSLHTIPIVKAFVAMGISMMLWQLFRNVRWLAGNRFLMMLGRHSLEIYVLHCIFTAGFRVVFSRIGLSNAYISVMLNVVLSTSIPLVISYVCRKLGIFELFFKPMDLLKCRQIDR